MLTYQEIVEGLAQIEADFDVTSLKIADTCVWPLIRRNLWFSLSQDTYKSKNKLYINLVDQLEKYNFLNSQIPKLDLALKQLSILLRNSGQTKSILDRYHQKYSEGSKTILFVSRFEDNSDQWYNLIYNRHIDPFITLCEETGFNWLKIEEKSKKNQQYDFYYEPAFYSINEKSIQLKDYKRINKIEQFDNSFLNLEEYIKQYFSLNYLGFNRISIIRQYINLLIHRNYYFNLLNHINPRVVFLVCFYSFKMLPIIWACRKLSIPCVDIQHGHQGKYHGMYSHWTNFPKKGYHLLPDYFWNWGTQSQQNILKWHPNYLDCHYPIVGGNLWLAQWKNGDIRGFENNESFFLDSIEKQYKFILITLQPRPHPLENFILKIIKQTQLDYLWLIRLHPRQKDKMSQIENLLKSWQINNYEIKKSTNCSLYSLLKRVHLHITAWSSTSIEALYFGHKTIITHSTGRELFFQYIREGLFSFANDYDSLLNEINHLSSKTIKKSNDYINTKQSIAQDALFKIVS